MEVQVTRAELREAIVTALAPRTAVEAGALVEAIDLFMAYCTRFGQRDKRFSLLDHTPPDTRAHEAVATIRERVVVALGKECGIYRTLAQSIRAQADAFDTSDVGANEKKES